MKSSTLLHIPHASAVIPARFLSSFDRSKLTHEIAVMTDWFYDELFDCGRDSRKRKKSTFLFKIQTLHEFYTESLTLFTQINYNSDVKVGGIT